MMKKLEIKIPAGSFHVDCARCIYADFRDKNRWGEFWCSYFRRYETPTGCSHGEYED